MKHFAETSREWRILVPSPIACSFCFPLLRGLVRQTAQVFIVTLDDLCHSYIRIHRILYRRSSWGHQSYAQGISSAHAITQFGYAFD
jgi:hypothetical protein